MSTLDDAVPPSVDDLDRDLSLKEAARLYDVSQQTLRNRVRFGRLPAYKTRGPWGHEWRINGRSLEAAGIARRPPTKDDENPRVAALEAEVARLWRLVAAERNRADEADRELGYAMLQTGRLRSALDRALQHHEECPMQPGSSSTQPSAVGAPARS